MVFLPYKFRTSSSSYFSLVAPFSYYVSSELFPMYCLDAPLEQVGKSVGTPFVYLYFIQIFQTIKSYLRTDT